MDFTVQILGSNSALPANNRYPSAQVVQFGSNMFLIDCGEGTQMRLSQFKVKRSKINHVFISHLHGDHVYGLPGLITSYGHYARQEALHIYGPHGIKEFVETNLRLSQAKRLFDIKITEVSPENPGIILQSDRLSVETIPLIHRIPTVGYLFRELFPWRNVDSQAIKKYNLTIDEIKQVKKGNDIVRPEGTLINDHLIMPHNEGRAYAYCSDTIYSEALIPYIKDVTTLYHEATYLNDMEQQAIERKHSTVGQAAEIAKKARVGKLIVGHYSSRYHNLDPFLEQGRAVFEETHLALEGKVFLV